MKLKPNDWQQRRRLPWWLRVEVMLPVLVLVVTLVEWWGR